MVLKHRIKLQNNCKEYKLKLKYLIERKNVILKKIEACECDLKEFKEEKNAIIDELLVHYHKLLMEGKETRSRINKKPTETTATAAHSSCIFSPFLS